MQDGRQENNAIYQELLDGTPKKEICEKLGVRMSDVDAAYNLFVRIRNSLSASVSPS